MKGIEGLMKFNITFTKMLDGILHSSKTLKTFSKYIFKIIYVKLFEFPVIHI